MIVTLDDVKKRFAFCNKAYFEGKLARPELHVGRFTRDVARIWWTLSDDKRKRPQGISIYVSSMFDFPDEMFTDIMCHEMIHLYMLRKNIKDDGSHGTKWQKMADELNEKYGLHITQTFELMPIGELTWGEKLKQFIVDHFFTQH